ncbi:MAG: hypothetical protein QXG12_08280 [Thermoproteota archaeon]
MADCRRIAERLFDSLIEYYNFRVSEDLKVHECEVHKDIEACRILPEIRRESNNVVRRIWMGLEEFKYKCLID